MKKLVLVTGAILIGCVLVSSFSAPATSAKTVKASVQTTTEYLDSDIYVLKSENNRIVVYIKGNSIPYMTTDTITDTLPQGDMLQLEQGIEVKGKTELRKALEDYCS